MARLNRFAFAFLSALIISCAPKPQPSPRIVKVYASPFAWNALTKAFACADELTLTLQISAQEPQIELRVGEPRELYFPAYQISEEEWLIAANQKNPLKEISLEEAQTLFAESAQVWVYPSEADAQQAFEDAMMQGRSVSSATRLALNPQMMAEALIHDENAVGILPRSAMTSELRVLYSAGKFPILALTQDSASSDALNLIACFQRKR